MIDLHYPPTTLVGKPVPKNAFYRHLEVNAKMKQHFVDDVVAIKWLYKLAPSTLNVAGVISGYGTSNSEENKRMVELESLIQKGRKEIAVL